MSLIPVPGAPGIERLGQRPRVEDREKPDCDRSMLMAFAVNDSNQLPIARQTVDELFHKCGFVTGSDHQEAVAENSGSVIKFYIPVVVRPRR